MNFTAELATFADRQFYGVSCGYESPLSTMPSLCGIEVMLVEQQLLCQNMEGVERCVQPQSL